jgi:hypothetical protein
MTFTETEAEILVNSYLLAREGCGQVLEPWAYPEACRRADAGWLERRPKTTETGRGGGRPRPRRRSTSTRSPSPWRGDRTDAEGKVETARSDRQGPPP